MALRDLFFPPKCVSCGTFLGASRHGFCPDCLRDLCPFQGRPAPIPYVKRWAAVWYYGGSARQAVRRLKFRHDRSVVPALAPDLARLISQEFAGDFDVLTYVPVSLSRRIRRGYDQVELLCREVARILGVPCVRTLRKVRNTAPQSSLKGPELRRANILGAYRPYHSENFSGKRVLLLDDIITTGATTSECAKTLLLAGAEQVLCGAVASRRVEK